MAFDEREKKTENIVTKLTLNCFHNETATDGELRRDRFFCWFHQNGHRTLVDRMHKCSRDKICCKFVTCARAHAFLTQWPLSENCMGSIEHICILNEVELNKFEFRSFKKTFPIRNNISPTTYLDALLTTSHLYRVGWTFRHAAYSFISIEYS